MVAEVLKFSAEEFAIALCQGKLPGVLATLFDSLETAVGRDVFKIAYAIGALEPLSTHRPDATEIVMVFDKTVTVPAATVVAGKVVPGEAKLIRICAPVGKSLMVDKLRALPVNQTAVDSGSLTFKRLSLTGFSDGFCPAGEPANGDDNGTFQNIEHILLRPEAGFDLYATNVDTTSSALVHVHAKMWAAC